MSNDERLSLAGQLVAMGLFLSMTGAMDFVTHASDSELKTLQTKVIPTDIKKAVFVASITSGPKETGKDLSRSKV